MKGQLEHPALFGVRFSRCYRLLHVIASRLLHDSESVDDAINNCWLKVSRNPLKFEYEGAFRAWLLRALFDEALAIFRETREQKDSELPLGQFQVGGLNTCRRDEDDAERSVLSRL